MGSSLLYKILYSNNLSDRAKRELELCKLMLSEDELLEISSIRTGYKIARQRVIEQIIQESDPWLFEKIKNSRSGKFPIFGLLDEARKIRDKVDFSARAILKATEKKQEKEKKEEPILKKIAFKLELEPI
jgi:hypothetical protein